MLRHHGGTSVKCGFFWNPARWEIVTVPKEGGVLPGGPEHRYVRIPIVLLLVVAPVMGGLYVVFLPFIGFALVFGYAGRRLGEALQRGFAQVMAIVSPAWRPGEAYFAGKRTSQGHEDTGPSAQTGEEEPLQTLEREIEAKRKTEA